MSGRAISDEGDRQVEIARRLCAARRRRSLHLPSVVLGEPGWDILLDLLVSRADGKEVPMHVAWLASGVPSTTAARCVVQLMEQGLISRRADPKDRRRKIISLTPLGEGLLRRSLDEAWGQLDL